jgi:hypothetical protein
LKKPIDAEKLLAMVRSVVGLRGGG